MNHLVVGVRVTKPGHRPIDPKGAQSHAAQHDPRAHNVDQIPADLALQAALAPEAPAASTALLSAPITPPGSPLAALRRRHRFQPEAALSVRLCAAVASATPPAPGGPLERLDHRPTPGLPLAKAHSLLLPSRPPSSNRGFF